MKCDSVWIMWISKHVYMSSDEYGDYVNDVLTGSHMHTMNERVKLTNMNGEL